MKILVPDKVDPMIKDLFVKRGYTVDYKPGMEQSEVFDIAKDYDALVVRSYKLHGLPFGGKLKAIGRAGAGVNNIPVDDAAKNGTVVFNAPGANANAVKELVVCAMLLASRGISYGIEWTKTLGNDMSKTVEKKKSQFNPYQVFVYAKILLSFLNFDTP